MSEKITKKKKPVPNSPENGSEVFVLPPQLLQKLGIDMSQVQDGSKEFNNEPYKSMPTKIKTKRTTRNHKTSSKEQQSSILETAQLMTSSVFLSPTFTSTSSDATISGTEITNDGDDDIPLSALAKEKPNSNSGRSNPIDGNDVHKSIINESNTFYKISKFPSKIKNTEGLLQDNSSKMSILETHLSKKPVSDIGEQLCSETMVMFGCHEVQTTQAIKPVKSVDDHVDEAYGSDCANSNSGASGTTDTEHEPIKIVEAHNFKALEAEIIDAIDDNLIGKVLSTEDFTLTPINMDEIILMSDKDTENMAVTFSDIMITDSGIAVTGTDTNHLQTQCQQALNVSLNEENYHQSFNQDLENAALLLNIAQILPENDTLASTSLQPPVSIANLGDSNELVKERSISEKCEEALHKNSTPTKESLCKNVLTKHDEDSVAGEKTGADLTKSDKNQDISNKVSEIASYLSKCAHLLKKCRKYKINKRNSKKSDKKEGAEEPGGKHILPSHNLLDNLSLLKILNDNNTDKIDCNNTNQETRIKQMFCICSDFGRLDNSYLENDMNQHVHYVNKVTYNSDVSYQLCNVNYVEYMEAAVMNQVEVKEDTTNTSDFTQSCWGYLPCIEPTTDTLLSVENNIRNQIPVIKTTYEKPNKNKNISVSAVKSTQLTTKNNIKSPSTISICQYDGLNNDLSLQNNRQQEDNIQNVKNNKISEILIKTKQAESRSNLNSLSQNNPNDSNKNNQDSKNSKEVNYVKSIDSETQCKTTSNKSKSEINKAEYEPSSITNTNSCIRIRKCYKPSNKNENANVRSTSENIYKYINKLKPNNSAEIKETEYNHVPRNKGDVCDINSVLDSNCKNTFSNITPNENVLNDIVVQSKSRNTLDNCSNESIEKEETFHSITFEAIGIENSLLKNTEMKIGKEKTTNVKKRHLQTTPDPVLEKRTRLSNKSIVFDADKLKIETAVKQTPDKKDLRTTRYSQKNKEKAILKSPKLKESYTKTLETNQASCSALLNKSEKKYKSPRNKKSSNEPSLNISSETDNNVILDRNLKASLDSESTIDVDTTTLENYDSSVATVRDPSNKHVSKLNGLSVNRKRKIMTSSGLNQDRNIVTHGSKTENIDKEKLKKAPETAKRKDRVNLVETTTDPSTNDTDDLANGCIESAQKIYADTERLLRRTSSSKRIDTLDTTVTTNCSKQTQSKRRLASKCSVNEIKKPLDTFESITNRNESNSQTIHSASKTSATGKIDTLKSLPREVNPKDISVNQSESDVEHSQIIISESSLQSNKRDNTYITCENTLSKTSLAIGVKPESKSELDKHKHSGANQSLDDKDGLINSNYDNLVLNETESSLKTFQETSKIPTPCRRSYSKSSDSESLITKQTRTSKRPSISASNQSIVCNDSFMEGNEVPLVTTETDASVKIYENAKMPTPCRRSYSKSSDSESLITKQTSTSKRPSISASKQSIVCNDSFMEGNEDHLVTTETDTSVIIDDNAKMPTPCRRSYSKSSDSETLITKKLRKSKRSSIATSNHLTESLIDSTTNNSLDPHANNSFMEGNEDHLVITETNTCVKIYKDAKMLTPCRRSISKSSDSETLITKKLRKCKRSSIATSNHLTDRSRNNSLDEDPQTSKCIFDTKETTPGSETCPENIRKKTNKRLSKINVDNNPTVDIATSNTSDNTDSDIQILKPSRRSNSKSSDSEPLSTKKCTNSNKSSRPSDTDQFISNIDKDINVSKHLDESDTTGSDIIQRSSDSPNVKCGVCNESMPKSEWYNHSGAQHLYKAWNDQEPAIDLDDENDVKKHILSISKVINGLKCYKCNYVTKYYSTLLKHSKGCDKKEMYQKLKGNEKEKEDVVNSVKVTISGKDNIMCCICMKQMLRKRWTDHAMIEHYNIAWNNEEEPLDISVTSVIERRLKSYKAMFNKLECRKCGISRASALGFFAHVIACGKSEEELDKFKETCDICSNKYLAVYRQQHYLSHRVKEQKLAMLEERRKQAEAARDKSPEIAGTPGKRRAAQRAINVIADVQKALSQISNPADGSGSNSEEDLSDSGESLFLSEHSESESDDYDENASDKDLILTDDEDDYDDDDDEDRRKRKKMPTLQCRLGRIPFVIEDIHSYITKSIKQHFNSLLNVERVHTTWNNNFTLVADSNKQRYMTLLQESCSVKTGQNWSKYEPFQVRTDPVLSIFVGSSPRSVCWVPAVEDVLDDSYLTVACYNSTDCPRYRCDDIHTKDSLIQIWNFHHFNTPPELALCIAIEYGVVWSMDWCPTGARDNLEETPVNPRLGLLAIACSDGNAYVMAIPHPSIFKGEKPLIKPTPAAILRLTTSAHRKIYQATAVCWTKEKGHPTLMVGYADGTVAHFDVNTESPFLRTVANGIPVLLPYQDEVVHSNYITNVLSHWHSGAGEGLQCASSAGGVAMWAGRSLHSYLHISATDAAFVPHWASVFAAMEDRTASQNECEWFMGGRRIGCGRAVAACHRCANFAVAHAPWISAFRPHPACPDFKRQTFAKIDVVPLKEKPKKPGGSPLDTKLEPLTYEETIKKYGIQLTIKSKNEQTEREYDMAPERFPLSEVTSIAYCPSPSNHHKLAAATHAGIIFILNSPKINIFNRDSLM